MPDTSGETPPQQPAPAPAVPTHADLFLAFFRITLSGFGGTLPWTRRMFVEEKRWMTAEEFNDNYALCQFLPGPNIVNLTAVFGSRARGWTGALAAWSGFMVLPFTLMLTVGVFYSRYGDVDTLRRILTGIAAGAAGLLIATAVKMAMPMFTGANRYGPAPFVVIATMLSIGVMRWPLIWVMCVLVTVSVGLAFWVRR